MRRSGGRGSRHACTLIAAFVTLSAATGSATSISPLNFYVLELTPLRFYDFKVGQREITRENAGALYEPVRISDFLGQKAVALLAMGGSSEREMALLEAFQRLDRRYGSQVQFLFVFSGDATATTMIDRMRRANAYVEDHKVSIPCVVPASAGPVGWFDVLLFGIDGEITLAAHRAVALGRDFDLESLEHSLEAVVSSGPSHGRSEP